MLSIDTIPMISVVCTPSERISTNLRLGLSRQNMTIERLMEETGCSFENLVGVFEDTCVIHIKQATWRALEKVMTTRQIVDVACAARG